MSEMISGRYRLERQLGAGGMAQVWLAHDTQLNREVALKLLGADADPLRFDREAQAIASLSRPNICRLFANAPSSSGIFTSNSAGRRWSMPCCGWENFWNRYAVCWRRT